jgi:hypothetical protein
MLCHRRVSKPNGSNINRQRIPRETIAKYPMNMDSVRPPKGTSSMSCHNCPKDRSPRLSAQENKPNPSNKKAM